jgi:hypothetical protein
MVPEGKQAADKARGYGGNIMLRQIERIEGRVAIVAVYWDADWSEYRVCPQGLPDTTYYTDDRDDAHGTAVWLAEGWQAPQGDYND